MDLYRMYIPGTSCTQCQPDSSVHSLILCVFLIILFLRSQTWHFSHISLVTILKSQEIQTANGVLRL